jgi:hypothetical protein
MSRVLSVTSRRRFQVNCDAQADKPHIGDRFVSEG